MPIWTDAVPQQGQHLNHRAAGRWRRGHFECRGQQVHVLAGHDGEHEVEPSGPFEQRVSHHEDADALAFRSDLLAIDGQGDGAVEGAVIGVAVERNGQRPARLQDGDDLEQVAVSLGARQGGGNGFRRGAVVVSLMGHHRPGQREQQKQGKCSKPRRAWHVAESETAGHGALLDARSMPACVRRCRAGS